MSVTTAYYRLIADVPPLGNVGLPGTASTKMSTVFGWGLAIVGVVAVLAMFGAAISWMVAKQNGTSTEGPEKAVKVIGAVILATSAIAIVNVIAA